MRKSIFYQPLAVLMTLVVAAPLSWLGSLGSGNRGPGAHLFQAAAQSGSRTNPIQTKSDVDLWAGEAGRAYLAAHNLPRTDEDLIYSTGRSDLRNEIRGMMFTNLLGIIVKPAADRTLREQATYSQFQKLVQEKEIAEYTAAVNEFNSFKNDPCHFKLDADIAQQYSLKYEGAPWCFQNQLYSPFSGPPVPAATYFLAYGYKSSYGSGSGFGDIVTGTLINTPAAIGAIAAVSIAIAYVAASTGVLVAASLPAAAAAVVTATALATTLNVGTIALVSAGCVHAIGAFTLVAGPVFIVGLAGILGTIAGIQTYTSDQNRKNAEDLSNSLASVTNNPPDLAAFASDKLGLLKLGLTFAAQTAPDTPGTAPLPSHRSDYRDLVFKISTTTDATDTLNYYGWNGETWSAQTYGGWLVQTCSSGACNQADSLSTSIRFSHRAYFDRDTKYTASRIGDHVASDRWAVTKAEPTSNDIPCPPDPSTGLTSPRSYLWFDYSHQTFSCSSFVTDQLQMSTPNGLRVAVSLGLRPGVSAAPPQFTSAASVQPFYDAPFNFLVTTTGGSIPAQLSVSWLPDGLTFTDNGDGTATIRGTVHQFGGVTCLITSSGCAPSRITATNPWGTATQDLAINFVNAPSATLATTSTTLIAGIFNAVTLFSQGAQTPVTWAVMGPDFSPLPAWLSVTVQGDGAAVFSGTPPLGTVAAIPLNVSVHAAGSAPGVLNFGANFTLNVSDAPAFVSSGGVGAIGDVGQFAVGSSAANISVLFTGGIVNITRDTLPIGLRISNPSSSTGSWLTIYGTPAQGTGGAYPVTVTATNSSGSASRDVTVEVFEQPKFTTNVDMKPNFYQGQRNSFSFTTSGYPDRGKEPMKVFQPAPTDPKQGLGMYFTVTGLPPSLTASNLDPTGHATGTLTISGTPVQADLGDHLITITATNGVGAPAQQTFTLSLSRMVGDVDNDGFTFCFDVLDLDKIFGRYMGQTGYNSRADINNDGAIDWADMELVWTHVIQGDQSACLQAIHKPSTPAVFQHAADGASTSHEDTIINYISSGGVKDTATLSKGIWTGLHGSGPDLVYETWDRVLWSAMVLPDGVTFQSTNPSTGEVRISPVLEYQTWDGSHWKATVIRPSW